MARTFNGTLTAAVLGVATAASVVGFAGAAHAAPTANRNAGMYVNPPAAAPYWTGRDEQVSITTFDEAWITSLNEAVVTK